MANICCEVTWLSALIRNFGITSLTLVSFATTLTFNLSSSTIEYFSLSSNHNPFATTLTLKLYILTHWQKPSHRFTVVVWLKVGLISVSAIGSKAFLENCKTIIVDFQGWRMPSSQLYVTDPVRGIRLWSHQINFQLAKWCIAIYLLINPSGADE